MENEKFESETTKLWDLYQKGLTYQNNIGLKEKSNQAVDFLNGNQWSAPTENTKNLPRPVFNIIEMIVNNKRANVLSSKIKMVFKPTEVNSNKEDDDKISKSAEQFTKFAAYVSKDLKQDELDFEAITDGFTKGMYSFHYYWDTEKIGSSSKYKGGLSGEIIDNLNIFFANPNEKNEQKQKWILISSRESVEALKNLAKRNKISKAQIDLITADESPEQNYNIKEQENESLTTVLTRYFRKDGEVYFEKATKNVIVQPAIPLTPNIEKFKVTDDKVIEEDETDTNPDIGTKNDTYKISLYPIVIGRYMDKKKNIYGQGLVEKIIPNNKAINFNYAMQLLAVQNIGFPKLVTKPGAIHGKITNAPGETLTDHSADGNGIRYLQAPAFSPTPMNLTDSIIDKTRAFNGATEVVSGEVLGANMSGSAIAALQTQAKVPIEMIQKQFWSVHEKIAKIWEQFFKTYYNDNRTFIYDNDNGERVQESFNGTDYQNVEYSTTVEIGAGSLYSEAAGISFLEALYNNKEITVDEYIELYPDNLVPFKATLKKMRETKKLPEEVSKIIMENPQIYEEVMRIVQQGITPINPQNQQVISQQIM